MKDFKRTAAALISLCLLSGCYTVRGVGDDVSDVSNWMQNKPSTLGAYSGYAPRGYTPRTATQEADETRREKLEALDAATIQEPSSAPATTGPLASLIPPQSFDDTAPAQPARLGHDWNVIDNYNATNPSLPGGASTGFDDDRGAATQQVVQYNSSVNVFPVDGDLVPYTQLKSVKGGYTGGGTRAQEVFFAHGSDQIGKMDRKNLHELAGSLAHGGSYRVDVVGHASHRVNGVTDPAQKKMINFKMAQKRATAVAEEMTQAGLAPDWIQASSAGDEESNKHRNGKSQEAADRRADVFVSNY